MLSARLPRHVIDTIEEDEEQAKLDAHKYRFRTVYEGPGRHRKMRWQEVESIWREPCGAIGRRFGPVINR